eukprot:Awhi_evm1s12886
MKIFIKKSIVCASTFAVFFSFIPTVNATGLLPIHTKKDDCGTATCSKIFVSDGLRYKDLTEDLISPSYKNLEHFRSKRWSLTNWAFNYMAGKGMTEVTNFLDDSWGISIHSLFSFLDSDDSEPTLSDIQQQLDSIQDSLDEISGIVTDIYNQNAQIMSVLSELSILILGESFNALVLNYEEQVSVLDFYFSEINYSIDVLQDNSGIHSAENKLSAYHRLNAVLGGDAWDIVGIAMINIEKYLLGLSEQVKGVVDYE